MESDGPFGRFSKSKASEIFPVRVTCPLAVTVKVFKSVPPVEKGNVRHFCLTDKRRYGRSQPQSPSLHPNSRFGIGGGG